MKRLFTAALFILSAPLSAQPLDNGSLSYCVERARTALDVAKSLSEGATIDKINLAFFHSPRDEQDHRYREGWAQQLKEEVAKVYAALPAGAQRAELAAQKIAETCAYEHGKKRRMKTVASSESLGKEARDRCQEALMDEIYIGKSIARKTPREEMEMRAKHNEKAFGPQRYAKIQALLEEAYAATNIKEWFDIKLAACLR